MDSLSITNLDKVIDISTLTEESFLIDHYYQNDELTIIVDKDGAYLKISLSTPIVYFSKIDALEVNNVGTIYVKRLEDFLDIDSNGYFRLKEGTNETYRVSHNKSNIALGYKNTEYSYLCFFKGSIIKNAFLLGPSNIKTIKIYNMD